MVASGKLFVHLSTWSESAIEHPLQQSASKKSSHEISIFGVGESMSCAAAGWCVRNLPTFFFNFSRPVSRIRAVSALCPLTWSCFKSAIRNGPHSIVKKDKKCQLLQCMLWVGAKSILQWLIKQKKRDLFDLKIDEDGRITLEMETAWQHLLRKDRLIGALELLHAKKYLLFNAKQRPCHFIRFLLAVAGDARVYRIRRSPKQQEEEDQRQEEDENAFRKSFPCNTCWDGKLAMLLFDNGHFEEFKEYVHAEDNVGGENFKLRVYQRPEYLTFIIENNMRLDLLDLRRLDYLTTQQWQAFLNYTSRTFQVTWTWVPNLSEPLSWVRIVLDRVTPPFMRQSKSLINVLSSESTIEDCFQISEMYRMPYLLHKNTRETKDILLVCLPQDAGVAYEFLRDYILDDLIWLHQNGSMMYSSYKIGGNCVHGT